ncbi:MAG TPA: carboxypeptidase-like regulatory domain-containing protein, partial [Blastocatellia bacterium]|nr:carboxypeptidase-like regulatory domain-containing protein [Blastocatellia bacterium]
MTRIFITASPLRLPLILVALTFAFSGAALAQQPLGAISGVVTDPNGAVVTGATATAVSLATGTSRNAMTNDQGFFLIPTLQAGDYKLTIEYRGFARFTIERVVVEVGQTARVDAALKITGTTESLQITGAETAAVDTQ